MEGRVILRCSECGRTREVAGEIAKEYREAFFQAAQDEGWLPLPGGDGKFIDGECLRKKFGGHETRDDYPKVTGKKNPKKA